MMTAEELAAIRERAEKATGLSRHNNAMMDRAALLAEVERLRGVVESQDRQLAARDGENAGERLWHDKADELQAEVERLRESVALVTRERDEWESNEQERARELDQLQARLDKVRADILEALNGGGA